MLCKECLIRIMLIHYNDLYVPFQLMSVVVNRDWRNIVESCVLENWREALAALVTYAKAEEFTALCDLLGQRLEQEGDEHCANAMVCYICAGNVEKFVSCW